MIQIKKIILSLLFIKLLLILTPSLTAEEKNEDIILSSSLSGTYIVPQGSFKELADSGFGIQTNLQLTHFAFKNSALMLTGGFNFINETSENIESFYTPYLSVLGGYVFPVIHNFKITSLLGFGYLWNIVEEKVTGSGESVENYFDPLVTVQCTLNISLFKGFDLKITPEYNFFFEQDNTGSYLNIGIGITKNFIVKSRRKPENSNPAELLYSLDITPLPFSPDNDGIDDDLIIDIKIHDQDSIDKWNLRIFDPMGTLFTSFNGKGVPPEYISWDGLSSEGELVQSAEDYLLDLEVIDNKGKTTGIKKNIPVDVLVIREGNRLKISISSITFPPDLSDLEAVENIESANRNNIVLKRLSEIFQKYDNYSIQIEGHANNLFWDDPLKATEENIKELIPLSRNRAISVKKALVRLGLDAERILTTGMGGEDPIVPFSDVENRWKNRRVEFILIKNE